ncbi:hypothetical protein JCM30471_05190 [Desulfuromonas carbonis]|uniref:CxxxxCH/CxxCH domain-containing protein n=1 Tax=Desulfuromonas sp. DDH964 TaxID=1823759 RepID=UPI00078D0E56|nr:CxxxxCH/CxxCH domain-containing protein [Desulfuromonas sp. DDH964]AMV72020.1 putative extracellular undecaheme cytochrome c [Desulfuromonas sp. DDH964]
MKLQKLLSLGLILWAAAMLLAGCGSSTNSASDGTNVSGPAAQGVLVDPYIVGAVLQEIGADGGVLQRQSTPTQADGSFTFPGPLTPGSTITIKPSPVPKHNGVDYHGILKRKVGTNASGTVVVSPLTTLLAGGASEQQVLDRFAASGLTGLSSADLYADPMAAFNQTGGVTAGSRLAPLQAAMAANAFMELTGNYSPDAASLSDSNFQDAVTIVTEILNSANFSALANDPAVVDAGTALTAADFVATATSLCQSAQAAVRLGNPVLNAIDTVLITAPAVARQHYVANHGTTGGGNGGNGGGGDAVAGKVVYDNSCSSCHKFGSADTSGFAPDLANKGSLVATKIGAGHNGVSLSATQVSDLAAYLDGATTPTPPPTPTPDGGALYDGNCAGCHKFDTFDNAGFAPDLNNKSTLISAKLATGHNGVALAANEVTALVDWIAANSTVVTPPPPGPTPVPLDGAALYDGNCAGCHKFDTYDTVGFAPDLNNKSTLISAKLAAGHNGVALAANEVTALVDWIAVNSVVVTPPPPDPTPVPVDGSAIYDGNCAGCHKFGSIDTAGFAPDLNNKSNLIAAKLAAGHNSIVLAANEIAALVDWIATNSVVVTPPPPDPTPAPLDGAVLYDGNCAGCHKLGTYDSVGFAPDLNNKSALIAAKLAAGHNGVALAANEVAALVDWVATNSVVVTPPPPPTPGPLDGAALYAAECAGCHLDLASTTKPGRSAAAISAAIAGNVGNMGYIVLTAEQVQAIADALPPADPTTPPGPDYSNCTACHGQPPNGSAYPNGAGAHAVHKALANVGTVCNTCHTGAAHNGWIDLGFLSAYNAKSGSAAENPNGTATCVNVSCHGGKTTPDWSTGSINVNSDCTACHTIGTGQYNSYNSGQHSRSNHARQACTVCHNTTTLATNHFTRLDTAAMEGPAAATIGGGSTRVNSYNASTRTCTTSCHGSERW